MDGTEGPIRTDIRGGRGIVKKKAGVHVNFLGSAVIFQYTKRGASKPSDINRGRSGTSNDTQDTLDELLSLAVVR